MFTELAPDLFVLAEPLSFYGFQVGRKMVVVRLSNGDLWINSPAELTDERAAALEDLGTVRYVTPASKLHGHLHVEAYAEAFPEAELFAAPGLDRRRTDLAFDDLLGGAPDPRWADEVDQTAFLGLRWLIEIEFFHRPSGTLILGDVCYNLGPETPPKTRLVARLLGVYGDLSVPRDMRYAVTNRAAARRSVERILEWPVERVVVGHGRIAERDAKRRLRAAFDWL